MGGALCSQRGWCDLVWTSCLDLSGSCKISFDYIAMAARDTRPQVGTGEPRFTKEDDSRKTGTEEPTSATTGSSGAKSRASTSEGTQGKSTTTSSLGRNGTENAQVERETARVAEPSSSSRGSRPVHTREAARTPGEKEVCWSCRWMGRIKTSHTYREGCDRYIPGATKAELIQAARGGNAGRRRFMEKLKRNEERPPAEDPRPAQVKKKQEKDKGEATLHFI